MNVQDKPVSEVAGSENEEEEDGYFAESHIRRNSLLNYLNFTNPYNERASCTHPGDKCSLHISFCC